MSDDRPEPPAGEPDDRTRPLPLDGTAPLDRTAALPPERSGPAAWSGRAEVRPSGPTDQPEPEWYAEDQGARRWWLPILWGVVVLLLVGVLGVGLWLALQSTDDDPAGPGPSPSPSVPRASPTTAAPTSAAPTSASPSVSPTPSAPARLPMPPVVNLPLETAQAILDDVGLGHRVEYETSDRPAGTVVRTEPEAGQLVPEDEEVTLVVARDAASPTGGVTPSVEPTATR
ncbi:PASTA domain-containing protein [Micromonospora sp. C31]|uniref:PASTA domain-containing protein n=1 Tax=Micromonospora sp. C31 TaxID=2824876 RepID=UPI001B386A08|nr:PASTA domain-containing protein [Micromonospora sp. C31]MBQ1074145.1 PASTA domain-containing protein [Micromonospora sp. C31]